MHDPIPFKTGDGSHSLQMQHMDETYHSRHGAIAESRYVFVEKGLNSLEPKPAQVRILEIGLGTGLNALLTLAWQRMNGVNVDYTSLEKHPLNWEILKKLNYPALISDVDASDFESMHACAWTKPIALTPHFTITKVKEDATEWIAPMAQFDLVFFDAFAPKFQPDMWTYPMLKKMAEALVPGGVFTTYCAQGQVRRDLQAAGLIVNRLPGPPGKREMLQAIKPR